jgi:hypothetical protein
LYFETRSQAEAAAKTLRRDGLKAVVGKPNQGAWWSVTVTGDEKRMKQLSQRLQREVEEPGRSIGQTS